MKPTFKLLRSPFTYFSIIGAASLGLAICLATPLSAQRFSAPSRVPDSVDAPSMQDKVPVMVQLKDAPASVMYAAALKSAQAQADTARNYALAHPKLKSSKKLLSAKPQAVQVSANESAKVATEVKRLDVAQQALLGRLTDDNIKGRVMFRVQRAYNGIAMWVSPDKISQVASLPGVAAVHPMSPKFRTATFSDIDFLNTRSVWTKPPLGIHGENIKVAVIDSGLDYIHANFGGPGTVGYPNVPDHTVAPNAYFPSPKVPGGYDFAGDNYDANFNDPGHAAAPDPDPFDCGGHGSACASLVAGYGVTNAGFTYSGNYDASNPVISGLTIPPGFAPNAKLFPLRVFGCGGSTLLVEQAIEWAMDPNGDGNFSDRVDVISMSLGSNDGYADDADDIAATNAAAIGINVLSAAGNAGDTYYIHSSPAAATGTLGIAASYNDQNGFIYDALVTANAPGAIAGMSYKGIQASGSPDFPAGGLTGNVVYAIPADGGPAQTPASTAPYTNAAQINGNICLVDRGGGVSFEQKVRRAIASGATGVIIANNANNPRNDFPPINVGLFFTSPIPQVGISKNDGDAIKAAAAFDANGVSTAGLNVTCTNATGSVVVGPNPAGSAAGAGSPDTLPTYSARGPRLPDSAVKPDVTAPAEVTAVALVGTGNGFENFNGTSSATPHVAGIMALMKQLHPTWSVQELNALICGTATHDLFTTVNGTGGVKVGVGRIGAGRVDVGTAGAAGVVAYNGTDPGLIGVSFGVVDVPVDGARTLTKAITVANKSAAPVTYNLTVQDVVTATGASFSVSAPSITVNAGSTGTFNVTYSVPSGAALRHNRDASTSTIQSDSVFGGAFRQFLTESNGYVVLTPTSGPEPTQRVSIYASPRPISSMHATSTSFVPTAASGNTTINLSGAGFDTGGTASTDEVAFVKPFELQYASPLIGSPSEPTDTNHIKYVGVTSDWASRSATERNNGDTTVVFGIDSFGESPMPRNVSTDKQILIDFDFDSIPDATIFLTALPNLNNTAVRTNVYYVGYQDNAGFFGPAGNAYVWDHMTNGIIPNLSFNPNNTTARDVNTFNNSAVHIPVDFIVGTGFTSFNYQVVAFDRNGNLIDQTPVLYFDVAAPGVQTLPAGGFEPYVLKDVPATSIPVAYDGTNFQNNGSLGVLLLHRHNANGARADAVMFRKPTISGFSPTSGKVGSNVTITGANFGPGTVVKFFNNKTAAVTVITGNTLIATVPAGAVTGPISVSNAAGASQSPGNFTVLP